MAGVIALATLLLVVVVPVAGSVVCWVLACRPSVLASAVFSSRRRRARYRMSHPRRGAGSAVVGARLDRLVMWADRHRCCVCGDRARRVSAVRHRSGVVVMVRNVSVDHVWPWAGGGLTWLPNGAALCRAHNLVKGNYSVDPDGYVHGHGDLVAAGQIVALERAAVRRPGRWLRLVLGVVLFR